jgi:glycosyltransferase involved in cell wall biosynthesis
MASVQKLLDSIFKYSANQITPLSSPSPVRYSNMSVVVLVTTELNLAKHGLSAHHRNFKRSPPGAGRGGSPQAPVVVLVIEPRHHRQRTCFPGSGRVNNERTVKSLVRSAHKPTTRTPEGLRQDSRMKLSVMMITYNHERFIAQALESVLAQQVNCDYEIVVGEDCSTDRTREILLDFQRRYPDKLVLLLRDHNVGGRENLLGTLAACRGQYVALLEGDDYWISTDKLQKQVDFLDAHPDYAICCSRAQILDRTGTGQHARVLPSIAAGMYTAKDLLEGNFIVTCTVVYRRDLIGPLPAWFRTMGPPGDWALHVLVARFGKINLLDEATSVYRVHSGGVWTGRTEADRLCATIRLLRVLDKELEFQYTNTARRTIARCHLGMAGIAREAGNRREIARHLAGYLGNGGLKLPNSRRMFASFTAFTISGSWYDAMRRAKRAIFR